MAQRGECQEKVEDGAGGSTNRESVVGAHCRRASKRRQRVLRLYHRRQDGTSMQKARRMKEAERVLLVSLAGVGPLLTRLGPF